MVAVHLNVIVWPVHSTHRAAGLVPLAGPSPTLGHAQDMAEVTEAALANCKKQVVFCGCICHSVILASDYVQASAVKTVHTAHHWLSKHPDLRCVCQRRTHSNMVGPQLQRGRQPVVCPDAGVRA